MPRVQPAFVASGILGSFVWVVAALVLPVDWAEKLILLGPLCACPLALALVVDPGVQPLRATWRYHAIVQFLAAVCAVVSFAMPTGPITGALVLPWVAVTLVAARTGLLRLLREPVRPLEERIPDVGMVYLPIGAAFLACSRAGVYPLDFAPMIVLLTAAHFHFAGLCLPVLAGRVGQQRAGGLSRWICRGIIVGVPLVGVGITVKHFHPHLGVVELATAWFLTAACVGLSLLQFHVALDLRPRWQGGLLALSALFLLTGMALAGIYALGSLRHAAWLTIPKMIVTHGTMNGLGFALPALIVWNVRGSRP